MKAYLSNLKNKAKQKIKAQINKQLDRTVEKLETRQNILAAEAKGAVTAEVKKAPHRVEYQLDSEGNVTNPRFIPGERIPTPQNFTIETTYPAAKIRRNSRLLTIVREARALFNGH